MQHSILVRWLCRIYAALLYAYPREFRLRYGGEMAQVFRDRCRSLGRSGWAPSGQHRAFASGFDTC